MLQLQSVYLKTKLLVITSNNHQKMSCYKTYISSGQQMYEIGVPNYDLIDDNSYFIGKPL